MQIRLKHYYPKCRAFCARLARRGIWLEKKSSASLKVFKIQATFREAIFFLNIVLISTRTIREAILKKNTVL